MNGRCGACGYFAETHDVDGKCHPATGDKNGRRGTFRPAPGPDPDIGWREIMSLDAAARRAESDHARAAYVPPVVEPPQVPARSPMGPGEIAGAGGRKQATKLGRQALAAGWLIEALYWRAADGTEGCALRLARDLGLRMVLTWKRPAGHAGETVGWASDVAYAWREGVTPATKIGHSEAEKLLETC